MAFVSPSPDLNIKSLGISIPVVNGQHLSLCQSRPHLVFPFLPTYKQASTLEKCEVTTFLGKMSHSNSNSNSNKFYIVGQPDPMDDNTPTPHPNTGGSRANATRPSTADTTATRPTTANSSLNDPFATPVSSRPPSIRYLQPPSPNASRVAFPDSLPTGLRNRPLVTSNPPSAFSSSARSSSRLSSTPYINTDLHTPSSQVAVQNDNAAPKAKVPRMRSHMLSDSNRIPKPWKDKKSTRAIVSYWIVYVIVFLGISGGAFQCYWTYTHVALDKQPLCIVLDENFDNEDAVFGPGGTFFREVNMDGFGNGEFEMTTSSVNNSFIKDGMLYIVPTLTSDNIGPDAILDGAVYNITGCTFNMTSPNNGHLPSGEFDLAGYTKSCSAISNATLGTVINPVQSARLTTRNSASIRFGRVEIRAKMPNGDWLWPALWMLPKDNVYGEWPLSGEIDLVESRGNGLRYTAHGSNYVQGSLNWGPAPNLNGVLHSYSWWTEKRTSFASGFHTYALEWTESFLRIYVDTRLHTLLDFRFNRPFFERGDFPQIIFNGSGLAPLPNPWINGTNATPFDQEFYLIMNVAVGATNGWFPEGQGDKPWLDHAQNPARDFIKNIKQWYPTWPTTVEDRAMIVDYVKMWKHCGT